MTRSDKDNNLQEGKIDMSCDPWRQKWYPFNEFSCGGRYKEPPFDANVLTLEQQVELERRRPLNPMSSRRTLAIRIRQELVFLRAEHEGREVTIEEMLVVVNLEEVIDWVPQSLQKGTSTLIHECYDLLDMSQKSHDLRVEKLENDYNEIRYDLDQLCDLFVHDLDSRFSLSEKSDSLLDKSHLENVLEIDKILKEIDNHEVEINCIDENTILYRIDGDNVDYFCLDSFKLEVDFVFPSNAFDSHEKLDSEENFKVYATFVVDFLCEFSVSSAWFVVPRFAQFLPCRIRRRTKGALAQPFDSLD